MLQLTCMTEECIVRIKYKPEPGDKIAVKQDVNGFRLLKREISYYHKPFRRHELSPWFCSIPRGHSRPNHCCDP